MLYIELAINGRTVEKEWHTGDPSPVRGLETAEVKLVQADGDELDFIYGNFHNVPRATHRRVVRWHGDFARFIAENL